MFLGNILSKTEEQTYLTYVLKVRVQTMTATMPLVWTLFQIMCFVASSERLELSTFPIELERIQFTRGMMFDLQTSSSDVFLEQIDQSIAGRFTEEESYGVQVYTRPGSHVSFEGEPIRFKWSKNFKFLKYVQNIRI